MSNQDITDAAGRYHAALEEADDFEWRVGHSDPQNVYAKMGTRPDQKDDPKVGTMRSPQHAARVIELHNEALARRRASARGARGSGWTGVQVGDGNQRSSVFNG